MRRRAVLLVLTGTVLVGCGSGNAPTPQEDVRAVVTRFGEASAVRDYQAICDDLLAPALVDNVEQYGLPCEKAFARGLGDVRAPRLRVGSITVDGDRASARVTSSAAGQRSSADTLALERIGNRWRISALQ